MRRYLVTLLVGLAWVAGCESRTAAPNDQHDLSILSVSPETLLTAIDTGATIVVAGSGFDASDRVLIDSLPRVTTFVDAGSLRVDLQPADLAVASAHTIVVEKQSAPPVRSAPAHIATVYPRPHVDSVHIARRSSSCDFTWLSVFGSGFSLATTVTVDDSLIQLERPGPRGFVFEVLTHECDPRRTLTFDVHNPAPGGGESGAVTIIAGGFQPVINQITPSSGTIGTGPITITLTGHNFDQGAIVSVNGVAAAAPVIDPRGDKITFTLPDTLQVTPGLLGVNVSNPPPGSGALDLGFNHFTLLSPVPAITSVFPDTVRAGYSYLLITGQRFVKGAVARVNGNDRTTTPRTATSLLVTLAPGDGTAPIVLTVANPGAFTAESPRTFVGGGSSPGSSIPVAPAIAVSHVTGSRVDSLRVAPSGIVDRAVVAQNGIFYVVGSSGALQGAVTPSSQALTGLAGPMRFSAASAVTALADTIFASASICRTHECDIVDPGLGTYVTGKTTATVKLPSSLHAIARSPSSNVYVALDQGIVDAVDVTAGKIVATVDIGGSANALAGSTSPAVLYVASASRKELIATDMATNAITRRYALSAAPNDVAATSDGRRAFVAEADGLAIVDLVSGTVTMVPGVPANATTVVLSADQTQLAVASSSSGTIQFVDVANARVIRSVTIPGTAKSLAYGAGGTVLLATSDNGAVYFIR
ncbi:MAG: cell surface receptor domain protein [Gemmatimonadetes bacterium]|nr:cell surface receptor domain protein [Gemmatimonadota bacterium]